MAADPMLALHEWLSGGDGLPRYIVLGRRREGDTMPALYVEPAGGEGMRSYSRRAHLLARVSAHAVHDAEAWGFARAAQRRLDGLQSPVRSESEDVIVLSVTTLTGPTLDLLPDEYPSAIVTAVYDVTYQEVR